MTGMGTHGGEDGHIQPHSPTMLFFTDRSPIPTTTTMPFTTPISWHMGGHAIAPKTAERSF